MSDFNLFITEDGIVAVALAFKLINLAWRCHSFVFLQ